MLTDVSTVVINNYKFKIGFKYFVCSINKTLSSISQNIEVDIMDARDLFREVPGADTGWDMERKGEKH